MGTLMPALGKASLLGILLGVRTDACTTLTQSSELNGACWISLEFIIRNERMKGF